MQTGKASLVGAFALWYDYGMKGIELWARRVLIGHMWVVAVVYVLALAFLAVRGISSFF